MGNDSAVAENATAALPVSRRQVVGDGNKIKSLQTTTANGTYVYGPPVVVH